MTSTGRRLQPLLHDLVSCVKAPSLVLSAQDGSVSPGGVQGWFVSDTRVVNLLEVSVCGERGVAIEGGSLGADRARFTAVARHIGDPVLDPTVFVEQVRRVDAASWIETVRVTCDAQSPVDVRVSVRVGADFATMAAVRSGAGTRPAAPRAAKGGLRWRHDLGTLNVTSQPPPSDVDPGTGTMTHQARMSHGDVLELVFEMAWHAETWPEFGAATQRPWEDPDLSSLRPDLARLIEQGLHDLEGLLLSDTRSDGDLFLAAGSPWFFTLFGRDSLWAARLMLPVSLGLAMSTLRTLARRQGTRADPSTEEEPGKILHEVRSTQLVVGDLSLPPVYFGSVDATPLWLILLTQAWRAGAAADDVRALMPNAVACMRWMVSASEGDGFLRYVDHTGEGLTNQGWKDSSDSIQWADGRLAEAPIALSEVQAYAYEAAVGMGELIDAFPDQADGETGERSRAWATAMSERFRDRFWVRDDDGSYPAIALDKFGRAVDSVASNMGHLLGTGILTADEAALIAARLGGGCMDSGFGLRTLTAASPRFSLLSYHGGTVWPHDTAIAILGLVKEGHHELARSLLDGLVAAAPAFGYRLPELYGASTRSDMHPFPIPYPAACRPQAWAAAAALVAIHPGWPPHA